MTRVEQILRYLISEIEKHNEIEFQRRKLAEQFSCAPSQINYILERNFKDREQFQIEIKRGSGGCIRINKVSSEWGKKNCLELLEKARANHSITKREWQILCIGVMHAPDEQTRKRMMVEWLDLF